MLLNAYEKMPFILYKIIIQKIYFLLKILLMVLIINLIKNKEMWIKIRNV